MTEYLQQWIHDLILENERIKKEAEELQNGLSLAIFDKNAYKGNLEKALSEIEDLKNLVKNREEKIKELKKG
jgi:predicted  nucleic acid-binding Zn-ribbon protein